MSTTKTVEPTTYDEAQARLKAILTELESDASTSLDTLEAKVREAKSLLDWSQRRLRAVESDVEHLLNEDAATPDE